MTRMPTASLIAVAFFGAATAAAGDPPSALIPGDDVWTAVEPEIPATPGGVAEPPSDAATAAASATPLQRSGRRSASPRSEDAAATQNWPRTIGSLAIVVGLIVLLTWGYRVVTGAAATPLRGGRRPGVIEVVSRTVLSPRQSICLVRVGQRLVLVGVTPERLTALDVVSDADVSAQVLGRNVVRTEEDDASFEQMLSTQESQYRPDESKSVKRDPSGSATVVDRARTRLLGALTRLKRTANA